MVDGVVVAEFVLFLSLPNTLQPLGIRKGNEKLLGDHRGVRGDGQKYRPSSFLYCLADSRHFGDREVSEDEVEGVKTEWRRPWKYG